MQQFILFLSLLAFHASLSAQTASPMLNILAIGDSNGAMENGWVYQLRQLRLHDSIVNTCISGNTIGFNNLDNPQLNTLSNIDSYITIGLEKMKTIDVVLVLLGTNDCKAVFENQLTSVPENLDALLSAIEQHSDLQAHLPKVIVVSPPPYGSEEKLIEKYKGATKRIEWLVPQFQKVADKHNFLFVDIYSKLLPVFNYLSPDGVHLIPEGQKLIALIIDEAIQQLRF